MREQVLHMLLRRAGCPQELRVQLTQGGHPWPRLAGTRWWDMMEAAGFFLQDRDPSSTGGAWHDCGDPGCGLVGALLVPCWCLVGALLVPCWCLVGAYFSRAYPALIARLDSSCPRPLADFSIH